MSPIGRIFLVLNLLLSAAFLGWASNALATTQDYKTQLDDANTAHAEAVAELEEQVSALQVDLGATEDTQRQIREARDQIEAERNSLQTQLAEAKSDNDRLRGNVDQINQTLQGYLTQISDMESAKDQAVQAAQEAQAERDAALDAQMAAENAQRDAQDEAAGLRNTIADLEMERKGLQDQVSSLDTQLAVLVEVTGVSASEVMAQPDIDAAVLAVKSDPAPGLVMLNVGAEDNVKRGYTFDIYSGNQYKGQVRVENVQDGMCSALILRTVDGQTMSQGDLASTRML